MVTIQEYINEHHKLSSTTSIIHLDNQLLWQSDVDLSEFTGLFHFYAPGNKLTDIHFLKTLKNKEKILSLDFSNNKIEDPDFDFIGNNFPNLQNLNLADNPIDKNLSLKGLFKCTKLNSLYIGNINERVVYRDMDYLPISSMSAYNTFTHQEPSHTGFVELARESLKMRQEGIVIKPNSEKLKE